MCFVVEVGVESEWQTGSGFELGFEFGPNVKKTSDLYIIRKIRDDEDEAL